MSVCLSVCSCVTADRQFQEDAKDASVSQCTWTLSALEALPNALYKFKTYLLTYCVTHNVLEKKNKLHAICTQVEMLWRLKEKLIVMI